LALLALAAHAFDPKETDRLKFLASCDGKLLLFSYSLDYTAFPPPKNSNIKAICVAYMSDFANVIAGVKDTQIVQSHLNIIIVGYLIGSEIRGKVCPYTQTTQGVGRTTVATKTLKAATKVLDQEQWSPLLRGVKTKGYPREEHMSCQNVKVALESATKTERCAMPTWCNMFNSTLTGNARVWFDDLPKETIDSYDDLNKAFLENYLQQKKCIKDPVKIHNIRQRDGVSMKEFMRRYKLKCRDVKGAPECMKISEFIHGITNPELIKRLHDKIPKSVDEMMRVTTTFLRGEVAASNYERKKAFPSWKHQEANVKQNLKN
ncbi:reverse transcriptase domain-containing protein, partial [Tanacetum coccineum]